MSGLLVISILAITMALICYTVGVWAFIVLIKNKQEAKERFHKFSLIVWAIWLIPYLIGMFMGMGR